MSAEHQPQCKTCAHAQRRYKGGRPTLVCTRYPQRTANITHCLDYQAIKTAITKALDYLKRASIK